MFDALTHEQILDTVMDLMSNDFSKMEGSYTNDIFRAWSFEACRLYKALNAMIPIIFPDETSGSYIDRWSNEFGITRRDGTKATGTIAVTGTDGTVIPAGKEWLTADKLVFVSTAPVIIADGTAEVDIEAAQDGTAYNLAAKAITTEHTSTYGITSFESSATSGGTDQETDLSLVTRLYDQWRKPATSGNVYHYEKWAKEVDGVGSAKVFPLWNGNGTVKVILADYEGNPASTEIVSAAAEYIETQRPIGATVTVAAATGTPINVAAILTLESGADIADVRAQFSEMFAAYISELVDDYFAHDSFYKATIRYNRIAYMLLSIDGVTDYTQLKVNDGADNIQLDVYTIPTVGNTRVVSGA